MNKIKFTSLLVLAIISFKLHAQNESVNNYLENGKTPLIEAVTNNDFTEVKKLVEAGAQVNLKEQTGLEGTPLMYATYTGNLELVDYLLSHGALVNTVDVNSDPALNWAAFYGQVGVMKMLIKAGANLNLESKHGSAAAVVLRLWHQDSVVEVYRHTSLAKRIKKNTQKLVSAVQNSQPQQVNKLLAQGVSPDSKDVLDIPVLQLASQNGNLAIAAMLLEAGANPNITNFVGQTPLSWAARNNHLKLAKLLLAYHANPNSLDKQYKLSPLIGAVVGGNTEIVELLIKHGATINHKDVINNAAALHWALFYNHDELAKVLIEQGANYNEKALTDSAYSAVDLINNYKKKELLDFIADFESKTNTKKLIGSWKIKEIQYHYPDSTYTFNDIDYGRFIFSESNYALMYNPLMNKRAPFTNLSNPSPEEIQRAFQSVVFNSGTYTTNMDVINTQADLAKVPGFEAGQQFYEFNFQGTQLSLKFYDEIYPNGNRPDWYGKVTIHFTLEREQD